MLTYVAADTLPLGVDVGDRRRPPIKTRRVQCQGVQLSAPPGRTNWHTREAFRSQKQGVSTMKVVGYVRVSSEDQARDGVSLDAQREKVLLFARLHGLDLAEVVADAGVSAKTLDRPGLSRVLAM